MNAGSTPRGKRGGRANPPKKPYTAAFAASLVREATGLDIDEKVMLFVIASHKNGEAYASRAKFEQQLAFTGNRLYKVRKKLLAKGLISWTERGLRKTTVYRINVHNLERWVENSIGAEMWSSNEKELSRDMQPKPAGPRLLGMDGVRRMQGHES